MRLQHCDDLQAFYDRVAPFLCQREAEHNMLLAYLAELLTMTTPPAEPPAYVYQGYVENEEAEVVAVGHYAGYQLSLSHVVEGHEAAFEMLLNDIDLSRIENVVVPAELQHGFDETWHARTGRHLVVDMAMRIYRLETVKVPANVAGTLRWATVSTDDDLLLRWMTSFQVDTYGVDPSTINPEGVRRWMSRFTGPESVYSMALWEVDGQPVSMAATTGRSPTGMRIGLVYTPPELRGRGYASAVTAALSQWLLDDGLQFCTLNTDLTNPTSNKIYQAIGYSPVCDQTMYEVAGEESR